MAAEGRMHRLDATYGVTKTSGDRLAQAFNGVRPRRTGAAPKSEGCCQLVDYEVSLDP